MSRLQIAIQLDVSGDERPEVNVTPIDIPLPESVANELERALTLADQFDNEPGDGEFDSAFRSKVPVRVWIINTTVDLKGNAVLRVKR
jgi:hypothetical protein